MKSRSHLNQLKSVKPKNTSEIDEKLAAIENELRQIIDLESKSKINIYAGTNENADLSNFATRPFTFKGYQFNSVEAAFQAMKIEESVPIDIDNSEIMDKIGHSKTQLAPKQNHLEDK